MSSIGSNEFGGVDVRPTPKALSLREQMEMDQSVFYDTYGFATEASINSINSGLSLSCVVGVYDRKPITPELFGQRESYTITFRTPNNQVSLLQHGDELTVNRKLHHVIHVEQDSNGDTILTLSLHDDVAEEAS